MGEIEDSHLDKENVGSSAVRSQRRLASLKVPFGMGDLALARSRMEAPGLWAELETLSSEETRSRVQAGPRLVITSGFHTISPGGDRRAT